MVMIMTDGGGGGDEGVTGRAVAAERLPFSFCFLYFKVFFVFFLFFSCN